ncbi:MAG TPA: T9SS type A sorting domain-containing protein [Ignavibacteriaceae bacterium]|nr:T9SS type A sorting domain-containing protein [Ignavibacteriaceae bacterium]
MKILIFSLLLGYTAALYPQSFHSLDGFESQTGETFLLYRLGSDYFLYNPVYKLNTSDLSEELIIDAYNNYFPGGQLAKAAWDFEFFPDKTNFMNVGEEINPDNHSYIARNDSIVFGGIGGYYRVDISKQDPMKVFAFGGGPLARSFDGGFTFPLDSMGLISNFDAISLADFDDNVLFGVDIEGQFAKNASVVDTAKVFFDQYTKVLYDVNQFLIYRANKTYGGYTLNVSNNKGNAFTWTKTYQSDNPLFITIDSSNSGLVYLADGRRIYKSTNNGYSFTLYKILSSKIVGIYKKPGADILYAATRNKIYKITPDSLLIIKSLPVPSDILEYYPLTIGNKWIYNSTTIEYNPYPSGTFTIVKREVLGDSIAPNGKKYFVIEDQTNWNFLVLERIDSAEAKVYRYADFPGFPDDEFIVDDLWAEVGDTLESYRMGYWGDGYTTVLGVDTFNQWGMIKPKKIFEQYILHPPIYSLTQGIGLDSIYFYFDFGETYITLKGCVLNGVVFGDTSIVVSVDDDKDVTPNEFILHQNYPNPFNPSTKISWQSPVGSWQTIKVFDVLGREVATLVDEYKEAGYHEVEFNPASGIGYPVSGVYFYRLKAGSFMETKKMILTK